jgi:hypothetical protein
MTKSADGTPLIWLATDAPEPTLVTGFALCISSNSAAIWARIKVGRPSLTEHLSELLSGYAALELTIYPYGDLTWRDRLYRGIGVWDAHAAAEQRTKH